jgi:predicted amidophosphoribosyltransferase
MKCKGIYFLYKASSEGKFRYLKGQKRCSECEIFLEWNDLHCPCCGLRLRTKPRNIKANARELWPVVWSYATSFIIYGARESYQ